MPEIPAHDELTVMVDGQPYTGWENVRVQRTLESVAGAFKITAQPTPRQPWPIPNQAEIEILLGEYVLLTGFVDSFDGESSDRGRTVTVSGRDRTADLVDCSALNDPGAWINVELHVLAAELCSPFLVDVVSKRAGLDPLELFQLQPGEKAWGALERACRMRATLPYTDGQGKVILASPGSTTAEGVVREGTDGNVMTSKVKYDHRSRHSIYVVRGQSVGSDADWGTPSVEGTARDTEVFRSRPLIVTAEGQVTAADAILRAEWEAATRAARSATVEVEVDQWRQGEGLPPWRVNELVDVSLPSWGLDLTMLIRAVSFVRDGRRGTRTMLSMVRRDAYINKPDVPPSGNPFGELLDGNDFNDAYE